MMDCRIEHVKLGWNMGMEEAHLHLSDRIEKNKGSTMAINELRIS